jgi:hypothetical protein
MFRVSKADERSRTVITIDGQLSGECTEVIDTCCRQAMSTGKPVHLVLRDVPSVDHAGCALLRRLAALGVHLFASGIYNSYLVRTLGQADPQALSSWIAADVPR